MTDSGLALVTGASRGIGQAIADDLVKAGFKVIRVSRSLNDESRETGRDVRADLATDEGIATVARLLDEVGPPDVLVNNAGNFHLAPVEAESLEALDEMYRVNLRAPFAIARLALPRMRARRAGRHILIGSVADIRAFPANGAYSATKFGARGLHEVLREEYHGTGIGCSLVSPGATDTSMWEMVDPNRWDDLPSRDQMLRPEDVSRVVVWIATLPTTVDVEIVRLSAMPR